MQPHFLATGQGELRYKKMMLGPMEVLKDSWVILGARVTRHRVMEVEGTRLSITHHTPQHPHRLKHQDWEQLRESGFPVDRVWEQGLPLTDYTTGFDQEDDSFSQAVMSVRQPSQASDVETQSYLVEEIDVDHNAFIKPTLHAICGCC